MEEKNQFIKLETTIQTAVNQAKCRKCGCMKGSLVAVKQELAKSDESDGRIKKLTEQVQAAIDLMEPAAYT